MDSKAATHDPFSLSPAPLTPNEGAGAQYGSQVSPNPPRQDMYAHDLLAGGPVQDRSASPATFTGGDNETGLGGTANPNEPGVTVSTAGGVDVQRGERTGL